MPVEVEVESVRDAANCLGVGTAAHAAEVSDHLLAAQAAELRHIAWQVTDRVLHGHVVTPAVEPEDIGCAPGGPDHAHEQPDRRRLAGAVGTEITENLLRGDVEVEVEEASPNAIVLREFRGSYRRDRHFAQHIGAVQLGELELHILMSGRWKADGGLLFGVVPKELWQKRTHADETHMIDCACVCLIARINGKV